MSENTTPKRRVLVTAPLSSSEDAEIAAVLPPAEAEEQTAVAPVAAPEAAVPVEAPAPSDALESAPADDTWWMSSAELAATEALAAPTTPASGDEAAAPGAPVSTAPVDASRVALHRRNTEPLVAFDETTLEGTRHLAGPVAPELKSHHSRQGLAAASRRDIGRVRKNNQDSAFSLLATLPRQGVDIPVGLFVVADGMGGHDGGEVASRLAVRAVVFQILDQLMLPALDDAMTEELQQLMITAVQEANSDIWNHAQAVGSDMGTTCTAVLLLGNSLFIAHVGDSRAYLLIDGKLTLITTDHSTVGRLIQMGQITPAEARDHPLRNQLYRTVGQQPAVQVDFIYQHLGSATHLLLCSDGMWGMLGEEYIVRALTNTVWPQDACDELIALANLAGGEDNISAVVVTLPLAERQT